MFLTFFSCSCIRVRYTKVSLYRMWLQEARIQKDRCCVISLKLTNTDHCLGCPKYDSNWKAFLKSWTHVTFRFSHELNIPSEMFNFMSGIIIVIKWQVSNWNWLKLILAPRPYICYHQHFGKGLRVWWKSLRNDFMNLLYQYG